MWDQVSFNMYSQYFHSIAKYHKLDISFKVSKGQSLYYQLPHPQKIVMKELGYSKGERWVSQ